MRNYIVSITSDVFVALKKILSIARILADMPDEPIPETPRSSDAN